MNPVYINKSDYIKSTRLSWLFLVPRYHLLSFFLQFENHFCIQPSIKPRESGLDYSEFTNQSFNVTVTNKNLSKANTTKELSHLSLASDGSIMPLPKRFFLNNLLLKELKFKQKIRPERRNLNESFHKINSPNISKFKVPKPI